MSLHIDQYKVALCDPGALSTLPYEAAHPLKTDQLEYPVQITVLPSLGAQWDNIDLTQ